MEEQLHTYTFRIELVDTKTQLSHPDYKMEVNITSTLLKENQVTKIFHIGEVYSGEEILSKLCSIKGFDTKATDYRFGYIDKKKKYTIIRERLLLDDTFQDWSQEEPGHSFSF